MADQNVVAYVLIAFGGLVGSISSSTSEPANSIQDRSLETLQVSKSRSDDAFEAELSKMSYSGDVLKGFSGISSVLVCWGPKDFAPSASITAIENPHDRKATILLSVAQMLHQGTPRRLQWLCLRTTGFRILSVSVAHRHIDCAFLVRCSADVLPPCSQRN
jgi:hypothetical protein